MLKALVKKQLLELNAFYFTNKKTGKNRGKAGTIGFIALFAMLFIMLGFSFFGIGCMLCEGLVPLGLSWYYFTIMAVLSILLGTFGSVFNTYAGLYHAKDNDLLLSMPIPPRIILTARIISVFLMSLLYSALVWLPACAAYMVCAESTAASIVFSLLLTFFITGFVTVLTCALGYLVALISAKLRNKSAITVIITLAFLAVYYTGINRINELLQSLITDAEAVSASLRAWAMPLCWTGQAAAGDALSMLWFVLFVAVLSALCIFVLSHSFIKITTMNRGSKKKAYVETASKASTVQAALLRKELKRFTSSATYMLNCGLGIVIIPAICIYLFIQKAQFLPAVEALSGSVPELANLLPSAIALITMFGLSTNTISAPSVSLEGKSLWIMQSLPVSAWYALRAKLMLHILINLLPLIFCVVIMSLLFTLSAVQVLLVTLLCIMFCVFIACFGLALNLKKPNLTWTNETVPVKQGMSVGISLFGGWALCITFGAGAYFLRALPAVWYLLGVSIVLFAACTVLLKWLHGKGSEIFAAL